MANLSTRDVTSFRVNQGGAAVTIDGELNLIRYTQGNGNLDARMDSTSVPGLSDQTDTIRIRLDLSQLEAAYWVAGNEYKFGVFDSGLRQYSLWIIGTAGAPTTIEVRDNAGVVTSIAYDPTVHRHLGHRWNSGAGTWHWEYSTDGITWADLHSAALQASYLPDDIAIVMLRLENSANAAGIGTCTVSRVNTPPAVAHAWPGFIKANGPECRSISPVLAEFSAQSSFRFCFKFDAEVFHRVVADGSKVDLLVPLTDGVDSVVVRIAAVTATTANVQVRTPDDTLEEVAWDVAANAPPAGEFVYCDVGQLATDLWLRMAPQDGAAFLIDLHDPAATPFSGLTDPRAILFPVVGDDAGHGLSDDDSTPLRMGAVSAIVPSGTPWTATADQVRTTGAESGLVEHWPCNDGVHATVLKGQQGAYDVLLGDGAVYGEHYWCLPSSRPLTLASLPPNTTLVRNVAGVDTPDPDAGVFDGGLLKLHRDGFETTSTYRLINDLTEIDFSYGGEWQIEAVTASWPDAMETANFDGQPASLGDAARDNILGIRVGYEPGVGQMIEQNATLNGAAITPANRAVIASAKAGGPWRMRIRVEGTSYWVDYVGLGTAVKSWSQAGAPMTLSEVRTRFAALRGRRSGKNNQGTAFDVDEFLAYRNEQIAGPTAATITHVVSGVDRVGWAELGPAEAVFFTNGIEEITEEELGLVQLLHDVGGVDRLSVDELAPATLVAPVAGQDRLGFRESFVEGALVVVGGVDRLGANERAPVMLVFPVTGVDRMGMEEVSDPAAFNTSGGFVAIRSILVNGQPLLAGERGKLWVGSDNTVELHEVTDGLTGEAILTGTGSATLVDKNGNAVGGQSWPVQLQLVQGATSGRYYFSVSRAAELVRRRPYVARVTFLGGPGRYWEIPFDAVVSEGVS